MIHIIIGTAGAGKTSWVRERWMSVPVVLYTEPFKHTVAGTKTVLLGDYIIDRRCQGTDTLHYAIAPDIRQWLSENYNQWDNIIMEGDRITNDKMFQWLFRSGFDICLYLVYCPLRECVKRLRAAGSQMTVPHIKRTATKSTRLYTQYASRFSRSKIIDRR